LNLVLCFLPAQLSQWLHNAAAKNNGSKLHYDIKGIRVELRWQINSNH